VRHVHQEPHHGERENDGDQNDDRALQSPQAGRAGAVDVVDTVRVTGVPPGPRRRSLTERFTNERSGGRATVEQRDIEIFL
jgi:hypothetical protein